MVLGRGGRRSRLGVAARAGPGHGRERRTRVDPMVARRGIQPRGRIDRGARLPRPGRRGDRLGGRGWRSAAVDERRAARPRRGGGSDVPGRGHSLRRSGRDLPADARRDGHRDARPRPDRCDLHADLFRVRRPGRRRPPSGLRGERSRHRGWLLPAWGRRADEGDRRRGRGAGAVGRPGDRRPAARGAGAGTALERGPRPLVGPVRRRGARGPGRRG